MIGQKFGRWTVVSFDRRCKHHRKYWICRCECGEEKSVIQENLKNGRSKSCGCLKSELVAERATVHGGYKDRRYKIAEGIFQRCNNPRSPRYKDYGGRGIVCKLGYSIRDVYLELLKIDGYSEELTIDRIDNNGHYELKNLRWTTRVEQSFNTRMQKNNTSGVTGISWDKLSKKWKACVNIGKKQKNSFFANKEEAVRWRKKMELEVYGYNK